MDVQLLKSETELPLIAKVLLQLRPQFTISSLIEQIKKQQKMGYQIAYVTSGENILCVAGFVISEKIAWGKHIYVDDLVTDEKYRSTGAGSLLINWLKAYSLENGCKQLHLDSGVQRFPAHRFYLREKFEIASHHFSITDIEQ
ncbi:GNAT family N-acetyltransferase [Thalassotalea psychrophila]|uniref:GNAT family N-acetyltransferase n=1 Tax=Thalassotalea psychrophila TaxID=3065647 RepID=A0ABY9TY27_9GAMM|nr:GNAT family N-acetyltransferase [Colwelliaceae bacterium SQ149]